VTKAKDERTPEELSEQELQETNGEPLPERQAMTLIRGVEPLPFPIVPDDGAPIVIDDPQAT
jgi:hypothetical protein